LVPFTSIFGCARTNFAIEPLLVVLVSERG
jgi:hypothetical protein